MLDLSNTSIRQPTPPVYFAHEKTDLSHQHKKWKIFVYQILKKVHLEGTNSISGL